MGIATVKILLVADTHLGLDLPFRPRVERRRRGHDFFANFERALRPALEAEVDFVVHGGDLLFRSRVPPHLVDLAFAPLRRVADAGVPVLLVPGNHERSHIPHALLAVHPSIHLFTDATTFALCTRGLRLAFAGFPYCRKGLRGRFSDLLERTGYQQAGADINLLCMHHCFEGATVGPHDYVFRSGDDVVRAVDLPQDLAAVLSGHIHRHQVLTRDLRGRRLAAPVFYPGSIERTSTAEMAEAKGYLVVEVAARDRPGGTVTGWEFRQLPARPMIVRDLRVGGMGRAALDAQVRDIVGQAPADAVVRLRLRGELAEEAAAAVAAPRLREIAPPTMNVSVTARSLDSLRGRS